MSTNYSLFEEPSTFDRQGLAARLRELSARGILIGGSSWKYAGWLGQVYTESRYTTRGRFSKRLFEDNCLTEYAETFPAVCGDFAFYQFPTEDFWRRLFSKVPETFQFGFKIPEQITCRVFPMHQRYGATAGLDNPAFLDAGLLMESFLRPLEPYRSKTGVLIFEFGTFSRRAMSGVDEFVERLDAFLEVLPGNFRYSVEIRNPEFLEAQYFACLARHNVAHVFNAWTKMPDLPVHVAIPNSRTADFVVCRALLKRGREYEEAVKKFAPYTEVQEVYEPVRKGLRELIEIARQERRTTFIFVNNRLEGNSPGTIVSITDD
ncbi:MAG TPA: DUF72 domain-containing protein [Bryobacteraceae bacterium]